MNLLTLDSRPPVELDVVRDVVRGVLDFMIESIVTRCVPAPREVVTDLVVAKPGHKFPGLSALVRQGAKDLEKQNTIRCYEPKKFEFLQFCKSVYNMEIAPEVITEDKVFTFLFYQAYRQKKSTRQRLSTTNANVARFDRGSFNDVIKRYTNFVRIDEEKIDVGNVVGYDCVNQYLCSVRHISEEQHEQGKHKLVPSDIMSIRVKELMMVVKCRKDQVAKQQFKERSDGAFQPFSLVREFARIELFMWNFHNATSSYGASSLRDRFQYLFTYNGVLRMESLYKADLSDLCDFIYHQKREQDPYHILIMRISDGKTNANKIVFGRVMRHINVNLCAIGGLGFYLMLRFQMTKEIETIDFEDNSSWFNIKLLTGMGNRKSKGKNDETGDKEEGK